MSARVGYLVGRLDRVLRRRLGEALRPHGITVAEYTALSVLSTRSGLSNAQLARRSLVTPQAMNEVLARLDERGLIRRSADPNHGRIILTDLTPAGAEALEACAGAVDRVEQEMLRGLSAAERRRLLELLTGFVSSLGGGLD